MDMDMEVGTSLPPPAQAPIFSFYLPLFARATEPDFSLRCTRAESVMVGLRFLCGCVFERARDEYFADGIF